MIFFSTTRGDSNYISVLFRNLKIWSPYATRECIARIWESRSFNTSQSRYCSKVADSCAMNIYKPHIRRSMNFVFLA